MKNRKSKLDLFLQIERRIEAGQTKIGNDSKVGNLDVKTNKLVWERNLVDGYNVSIQDNSSKHGERLNYSVDANPLCYNIDDKDFCRDEIINGENDKIKYLFKNYNLENGDKKNIISLAEEYGNLTIANIDKSPNEYDISTISDKMKNNLKDIAEEVLDLASDKKFRNVVNSYVMDAAKSHLEAWLKEDGSYDGIDNINAKELESKLHHHDDGLELESVALKMFGKEELELFTLDQEKCFVDLFHKSIVNEFKKENDHRYKHPGEIFENKIINEALNIKQREKRLDSILEDLPFSNLKFISNEVYKKFDLLIVDPLDLDTSTNIEDQLRYGLAEILPSQIKENVFGKINELRLNINDLFNDGIDKTKSINVVNDIALNGNNIEKSSVLLLIKNNIEEGLNDKFDSVKGNYNYENLKKFKTDEIEKYQHLGIDNEILKNVSYNLGISHPKVQEIEPNRVIVKSKEIGMSI